MNFFPPDARFFQNCTFETDPDGDVVLLIPPPAGWFKRLLHGSRPRRLQLDRLGSAVFSRCTEGPVFDELFADLQKDFPDTPDLERRCGLFLRYLAQQGWVRVGITVSGSGSDPEKG